jgi:SRSO17 transposase
LDLQEFDRLEDSFRQFHAYFAPAFGRKQWRERRRDYLRGLLVQAGERGNAENLAEAVEGASARVLQRFLTEANWDALAVTEALHRYLAPRLAHPEAVWIVDESDFPKQGKKSVGVARQYCGALGKIASCQPGSSWPIAAPAVGRWSTSGSSCRRSGRMLPNAVPKPASRQRRGSSE